jgi:tetratricopeptide (TPR) repeat protein
MRYRDAAKPVAEVGRELNVEGVIEGRVRRAGNRVAITVQLVRAETGENLWADTYQRDLTDVLMLQSEMAQAIARAVGAALAPDQKAALSAARKVNPAAYDAYLQGRKAWWGKSAADQWQAKTWFDQSIALDPGFALAYANLGQAYLGLGIADQMRRHDAYTEAERLQEWAVALDNTPETRLYLAKPRANTRNAWPELTRAIDDVLAIDANNASVYFMRAQMRAFFGQNDEAIADWRKGMDLEPLCRPDCEAILANFHRWAGRDDEAMQIVRTVLRQSPNAWDAWRVLALLGLQRGAPDDAIAAAETLMRLAPDDPRSAQMRAYVYAKAGKSAPARRILAELEADWSAGRPTSPVMIGAIELALGRRDRFFPWLERGFDDYDPVLYQLQDPIFDPVRDDPRFQWAMKRRSGQVQGPYSATH